MTRRIGVAGRPGHRGPRGGPRRPGHRVAPSPAGPGAPAASPATLTAHKGHNVEIKVTNTASDKAHGFSIDEFGVKKTVDQGRVTTVKFKANKAGTFKVYCQIHPTHKPAELTVS